jgi:hypothetical protein
VHVLGDAKRARDGVILFIDDDRAAHLNHAEG